MHTEKRIVSYQGEPPSPFTLDSKVDINKRTLLLDPIREHYYGIIIQIKIIICKLVISGTLGMPGHTTQR